MVLSYQNETEKRILAQYKLLIRDCRSISSPDELKDIRKAFRMVNEACRNTSRKMGELSIFNSLAVARIVSGEIGLGGSAVISALLADFVYNDTFSLEQISLSFGPKVAEISDGLNKIFKIRAEKTSSQAENLRNLILSLSSDIRIVLIKIAERLYIMRMLDRL